MIENKILCLIAGLCAGIIRSILGWLESDEKFMPKKLALAVIRTGILGATIGFGLNQHPIAAFFEVFGIDALIHKAYKVAS